MNKHDRDTAITEMGHGRRRYIVWFNHHLQVFTRFDDMSFLEVRI